MKFSKFLELYGNKPFIEASTFPLYSAQPQQLRSQVSRWIQKGWLIPLKRGLYVFGDVYRRKPVSLLYLANCLNRPSYISMEYALGLYGLIPEKVVVMTAVTTKKTVSYDNAYGRFKYYSIQKNLFAGYVTQKENGREFFIASPEKALLDYFYFNQSRFEGGFDAFESMRFQNLDQLNYGTLRTLKGPYGPKMRKIVTKFIRYAVDVEKSYKKL